MPALTLSEHTRLARLATDRVRRAAIARLLGSPLLRWRYGAPVADELLIVPQEIRTADPSFAAEVEAGHFGFAGACAYIGDGSPFDLHPPSAEWARELHGFGWLRHLRAAENESARRSAVSLVSRWIRTRGGRSSTAWEPAVIGRRLMAWIANAPLLLDGVDQEAYDLIADSLGQQLVRLSATWRDAPEGHPRLLALTALVLADLCVAGHDRHLSDIEAAFSAEIERQILADGGHISRNPGAPVELLLDFLPLRQCFAVRDRPAPAALNAAIDRMMPMLRFMRLGNAALARFNGMGAPNVEALATVLAYSDVPPRLPDRLPHSGYVRLERGDTVVIADVGAPPPLEMAGQAHAGCLSFEMSAGRHLLLVNNGAPGPADQQWRAASRATASHNTLCLDGTSSSRLVRNELLENLVGGPPIRSPEAVSATVEALADGGIALEAGHDGYLRSFGLVHTRRLELSADGRRLCGRDRLGPASGRLRLAVDVPFAIHFHLHPAVSCGVSQHGVAALRLPEGETWLLSARGAELSIEDSTHYADLSGPRKSLQVVLRGACFGESLIDWAIECPGPAPSRKEGQS
jgi:uncharacterized heparinase superfamily protein